MGRELYTAPFIWVNRDKCTIEENGKDKYGRPRYTTKDRFSVEEIAYEGKKIVYLVIKNDKSGKIVFTDGKKPKAEKPVQEKQTASKPAEPTTSDLISMLESKLNESDIPAEFILKMFGVAELSDIPAAKLTGTISLWDSKVVPCYRRNLIDQILKNAGDTQENIEKKLGHALAEATIDELQSLDDEYNLTLDEELFN